MPRVLNFHDYGGRLPDGAKDVSRSTRWGNPFGLRRSARVRILVASREEAISKYEQWIEGKIVLYGIEAPTKAEIREYLAGYDLCCSCAPLKCHGDVLLRIANT